MRFFEFMMKLTMLNAEFEYQHRVLYSQYPLETALLVVLILLLACGAFFVMIGMVNLIERIFKGSKS